MYPTLQAQKIKIGYDIQLTDNSVKQILGCILLQNQKHFYIIEFAMQNIKLAFKLCDWLWFKKKFDCTAV